MSAEITPLAIMQSSDNPSLGRIKRSIEETHIQIPKGEYQVKVLGVRKANFRGGPKIYLQCLVESYKEEVILARYYNVDSIYIGAGDRRLTVSVGRKSDLLRDYVRLFKGNVDSNRLPVETWIGKRFLVEVESVHLDRKKHEIAPELQYSKVGHILELIEE